MIEYEIIKHDKIKNIRVFINSIKLRSPHMHHDIELFYVLDGEGTIVIKNKKYHVTKGDSVLINAYDSHEILAAKNSLTLIIIQFSKNLLSDLYPALNKTIFIDSLPRDVMPKEEYQIFIKNIIELSYTYIQADSLFELKSIHHLSIILFYLFKYLKNDQLSQEKYSKLRKQNKRIDRINSYIDEHYQEQIRLSEIAELEKISVTHLSHFITKQFGMTFNEYLTDKRLECSLRQVSNLSLSLSEIAINSGFSELKYMTKAFKKTFGLTPKEYRLKGLISLPINKKTTASEYIYSNSECLDILNRFIQ
ncbi:MAG: helix-turn-helix domain-containing protein [Erysipelotrichaceae bacterium]|nr:helix-turn-helix domain-containing protein [Erysipelotrichaceae bacterium]